MKLSAVMEKLGRGEALTPYELAFMKEQMDFIQNTTAITSGWINGNGIKVPSLYADRAEFRTIPGGVVHRGFISSGTPIAFASGDNYIDWDTVSWTSSFSDVYPCVTFTATKIDLPSRIPTTIMVSGNAYVSGGPTELHYVTITLSEFNRLTDAFSAGAIVSLAAQNASNVACATFSTSYYWSSPATTYLKLSVNSGLSVGETAAGGMVYFNSTFLRMV